MNNKAIGEKGQNIVIGEFAKWDIPVGIMLSDNLPFELIAYLKGKLFRLQVKTSNQGDESKISFDMSTSNWHRKTTTLYTKEDCDVIVGYDMKNDEFYLLTPDEFEGRRWMTIRRQPAKNGQTKGINLKEDYVMSSDRINKVFQ